MNRGSAIQNLKPSLSLSGIKSYFVAIPIKNKKLPSQINIVQFNDLYLHQYLLN